MRKEAVGGGLASLLLVGSLAACSDQSVPQHDLLLQTPTPTHRIFTATPEPSSTPYISSIHRPTPTFAAPGEIGLENLERYQLIDRTINLTQEPNGVPINMFLLDQSNESDILIRWDVNPLDTKKEWKSSIITNLGTPNLKKQYPYKFILTNQNGYYYSEMQEFDLKKNTYVDQAKPQLLLTDHNSTKSFKIRIGNGFIQTGQVDVETKMFVNDSNTTSTFQIGGRIFLTIGEIEQQNSDIRLYRYDIMGTHGSIEYKGNYKK